MPSSNQASSSNPAFRNMNKVIDANRAQAPSADYLQNIYDQPAYQAPPAERGLTVDDVVAKTATVLGVAIVAGAIAAWTGASMTVAIIALVIGLVLSLIVIFKQSTNPALILGYAVAEGVLLGAITGVFENKYDGIATQAILGTLGVFFGMLVVYKTGAIRVTPKFTKMIIGAMIGLVIMMVGNLLISMFGGVSPLRDGGTFAIIFSIVCIAIAAFSFLLDFEAIDQAIKAGAPAKTSWYFAFGLMVTLVWLYLEILRLLGYARSD